MDLLSIFAIGIGATAAVYSVVSTVTRFFHPARLVLLLLGVGAVIWGYASGSHATGPLAGLTAFTNDLAQFIVLVAGSVCGWKVATHD